VLIQGISLIDGTSWAICGDVLSLFRASYRMNQGYPLRLAVSEVEIVKRSIGHHQFPHMSQPSLRGAGRAAIADSILMAAHSLHRRVAGMPPRARTRSRGEVSGVDPARPGAGLIRWDGEASLTPVPGSLKFDRRRMVSLNPRIGQSLR
jgi:hypothetical protein